MLVTISDAYILEVFPNSDSDVDLLLRVLHMGTPLWL